MNFTMIMIVFLHGQAERAEPLMSDIPDEITCRTLAVAVSRDTSSDWRTAPYFDRQVEAAGSDGEVRTVRLLCTPTAPAYAPEDGVIDEGFPGAWPKP